MPRKPHDHTLEEPRNPDGFLAGKLLIAMPNMSDPRFQRSVIFICAHDRNGAMGIVINNEIPGVEFDQLLQQLDIASDIKVNMEALQMPVMNGGPVENARGFLLHSSDFKQSDTITIDDFFSVSGTVEALKKVAQGQGPRSMLFALGYAGWGRGQLERELQDNAWLVVDADPSLIFHAESKEKWDMAIQKLGVNPAMLSGEAGRA